MKLSKETIEKYHKFDIDLDKKEYKILRDYGLKLINSDDEALINYAVNKILGDAVKEKK